MADPAEGAARPYPQARRDDEPEDSAEECSVVDLPDAGYEEREDRGETRIRRRLAHFSAGRCGRAPGCASGAPTSRDARLVRRMPPRFALAEHAGSVRDLGER